MQKYVGRIIEIIYQDRKGQFTKRRIRVLRIDDVVVKAYCYAGRGPRLFYLDRILAIQPIVRNAAV
ncbi:hypothetical protein [Marinicrinis lubricantis]|uniref:WYL domain-containing protein n=1 Tax=Marinicrinis lubricantis TaxID=2086470 RepID=A0ABW1IUA9_9BACL